MASEYVTSDGTRHKSLSDLMEYDHVIMVSDDGSISEPSGVYAPSVTWQGDTHQVDGEGWSLMNGYSGQYLYSGPVMHPSEGIGGDLAYDITHEAGLYVAVSVEVMECDEHCEPDCQGDHEPAGWAVAVKSHHVVTSTLGSQTYCLVCGHGGCE